MTVHNFPSRRGMTPADAQVRHTHDPSYDLDDGSYSPDAFYVASTNSHDHSETAQVKMPKHLKRLISQFIQDASIPAYKSANDVIRDALVHRLRYLATEYQQSGAMERWVTQETARQRLETIRAELESQRQLVEFARETTQVAVDEHDPTVLEEVALSMSEFLKVAREPHKSNVIEHLRVGFHALGMDMGLIEGLAGVEEDSPAFGVEILQDGRRGVPDLGARATGRHEG